VSESVRESISERGWDSVYVGKREREIEGEGTRCSQRGQHEGIAYSSSTPSERISTLQAKDRVFFCVCMCVYVREKVCACVFMCERERESERECVDIIAYSSSTPGERMSTLRARESACV